MSHPVSRQAVDERLAMWDKVAAIEFCRLAQQGAEFENVRYPTGLCMVVARLGNFKSEVRLAVAKQLRQDGYRFKA